MVKLATRPSFWENPGGQDLLVADTRRSLSLVSAERTGAPRPSHILAGPSFPVVVVGILGDTLYDTLALIGKHLTQASGPLQQLH